MEINREVQYEILNAAADSHPRSIDYDVLVNLLHTHSEKGLASNLQYLSEHGLISKSVSVGADGHISLNSPTITSAGLDFLLDDGGLSAILGVVTIKIHQDSIRDLLLKKDRRIARRSRA